MGEQTPENPLERLQLEADAWIERNRYAEARRCIAQGLQLAPEDLRFLYLDAYVAWREDRNGDARSGINHLLSRAPDHFGGRVLDAILFEEEKRLADAESVWIDLLREYPESPYLYGRYGKLMLRTLHIDKAGALAHEGLRFDPEDEDCLFLASMVEHTRGKGDTSHLAELLRNHPDQLQSAIALIIALSDQGRNRTAHRLAQDLLRAKPDSKPLLDLVRSLKASSHWTLIPLWPMQRWGWTGAIVITVAVIVGLRVLDGRVPDSVTSGLAITWLLYCIYSWVWPSILRRFT